MAEERVVEEVAVTSAVVSLVVAKEAGMEGTMVAGQAGCGEETSVADTEEGEVVVMVVVSAVGVVVGMAVGSAEAGMEVATEDEMAVMQAGLWGE